MTAARSRIGCRRPRPAAMAASRRSSPTDSTVTTRTPASTAAASSSSRLPGPVTTMRSAAMPARTACRSSPAEATSAPSPSAGEVPEHREVRVGLDGVGEVERRRQGAAERLHLARDDVEVVGVERRAEAGRELRGVEAAEPSGALDLVAGGRTAAPDHGLRRGGRAADPAPGPGSSQRVLERDPGVGAGVAVLHEQRDGDRQPVLGREGAGRPHASPARRPRPAAPRAARRRSRRSRGRGRRRTGARSRSGRRPRR